MKVYPNPVFNILTLHWEPSEAHYADLIISNLDGKVVLKQKVESVTTPDHRLDLKILGLSPGMYLISLINRDSIVSKRVILTG
ncbi:MAG TPA: T9SS type A sorting domain-containing protein [Saprospiraceae bacterium]|nr:T9SS type A sorting domain-containing protein [Saprospiraceae bacterium]HNT20755.1 T9SS type A sorting domain-containing protein [Saprospiraceae bacterium]